MISSQSAFFIRIGASSLTAHRLPRWFIGAREDVRMAVDADGTGEIRDVVEYRVDRAFGPRSGDTEVNIYL